MFHIDLCLSLSGDKLFFAIIFAKNTTSHRVT